jgi:phosphate-selective porin
MKNFLVGLTLAAVTLSAIEPPAIAQVAASPNATTPSAIDVFNNKNIPNTVKLKEMTTEWRGFSVSGQFDFSNFQAILGSMFDGAFNFYYYTKGQTINISGETYIIAYSLQSKPEKIGDDTPLALSLLNLKTIGSLTNIRPFDLRSEVAALNKQAQAGSIFNPMNTPTKTEETPPAATPKKTKVKNNRR